MPLNYKQRPQRQPAARQGAAAVEQVADEPAEPIRPLLPLPVRARLQSQPDPLS